jgi:outer membrane protein OmpA-like peptidoglycan-associated protein
MARLLALVLVIAPAIASAEPAHPAPEYFDVGGFLGPRFFSQISALGWIDGAPGHPMLENSIELGGRISHPFIFPWLNPEFELAISPTSTHEITVNGADIPSVAIFWMEPRAQIRIDPWKRGPLAPFFLVGAGAPVQLSAARKTINSGISGDGYLGGGVRYDTGKGFLLRFDARLAFVPGVQASTGNNKIGFEGDFNLGVQISLGKPRAPSGETLEANANSDRDGDGIPDSVDKCPDRAEDFDGFEDQDGCPDIDNDGDGVLDIADQCPKEKETLNGYQDEDGCPDTVPPEISALEGTIEGLIYASGETVVHSSARPHLAKIVKMMNAHPSIKIVLTGYTDDREAKELAIPPGPGQPAPDVDTVAIELAQGRAEAVKQALVAAGIADGRIVTQGMGAQEPVADNATQKGRFANRRVAMKLFVAQP